MEEIVMLKSREELEEQGGHSNTSTLGGDNSKDPERGPTNMPVHKDRGGHGDTLTLYSKSGKMSDVGHADTRKVTATSCSRIKGPQ